MDEEDESSMYTAVVFGKDRAEALSRAKSEAAQYFDTTADKILIISESGELTNTFEDEWIRDERVSVYKDWNFKITCLCIVDKRPVGIKI